MNIDEAKANLNLATVLRGVREDQEIQPRYTAENAFAIEQGLIELIPTYAEFYFVTAKGREWLQAYSKVFLEEENEHTLDDAARYWLSGALYYSRNGYRWAHNESVPEGAKPGAIAVPYSRVVKEKLSGVADLHEYAHLFMPALREGRQRLLQQAA